MSAPFRVQARRALICCHSAAPYRAGCDPNSNATPKPSVDFEHTRFTCRRDLASDYGQRDGRKNARLTATAPWSCAHAGRARRPRADARDHILRTVVRRMGYGRRARVDLHRSLHTDSIADCVAGGRAGAARLAGAAANGHAHRPVRRAAGVFRTAGLFVARCVLRSVDQKLSVAPRRGISDRHGRIVVLRRRGIRIAVDPGGPARHRPGHLRPGHDGTVTRRIRRTSRGRAIRLGGGVPRDQRVARGVGGCLLRARPQSAARRASCRASRP